MVSPDPFGTTLDVCSALEEMIRDERHPADGFCVLCFSCIPDRLAYDGPDIVRLRTQNHNLWDACIRSLTVPRSAAEKATLRRRLQDNIHRCQRRIPEELHDDLSVGYVADPLHRLDMLLCLCLSNCFYGVDESSGNTVTVVKRTTQPHKPFRSASRAWPIRIEQLFPYGPARTIDALVDASCAFSDTSALWVLSAVLRLARPLVWESLLRPDNYLRLAWAICAMLLFGVSSKPEHVDLVAHFAPEGCSVPQNLVEGDWLSMGYELEAIVAFLNTIRVGPYSHPDDPTRFATACDGAMTRPFRIAFRIAAEHHKPTSPQASMALRQYLMRLETHVAARERVPYAELVAHVEQNPRAHMVLCIVRVALNTLSLDRACAAPGCSRTMFDFGADEKPLPTCGRCKLLRYCCRECQRADWRAGHRRLCAAFVALLGVASVALPSDEFVRAVRPSAIPDADLIALAMWALGRGQHMQDILACDIASGGPHHTATGTQGQQP